MIRAVVELKEQSGDVSPLFPRIFSVFCYGLPPQSGVWEQVFENVRTALFSIDGGILTLILFSPSADLDELTAFFRFHGVTVMLTEESLFVPFPKEAESLLLMRFNSCSFAPNENVVFLDAASRTSDYYQIYSLLGLSGCFDAFFADLSRKIMKQRAFCTFSKNAGEKIVSCAVSPFVSRETAVISGVATIENERRKGYASACVQALCLVLGERKIKSIFLWCVPKNVPFYEKNGFALCGHILEIRDFTNGFFRIQ